MIWFVVQVHMTDKGPIYRIVEPFETEDEARLYIAHDATKRTLVLAKMESTP